MRKQNKPTEAEIKRVMSYYSELKEQENSVNNVEQKQQTKLKHKRHMIRMFFREIKLFFYNEKEHALRKGPILMAFFINLLGITSVIGWSIASKFIKGAAPNMTEFAIFMGCAFFVGINLYSMFKSNTMAIPATLNVSAGLGGVTTALPTTISNAMNTLTGKGNDTKSPSTPTPPAAGTPLNNKIIAGDNR